MTTNNLQKKHQLVGILTIVVAIFIFIGLAIIAKGISSGKPIAPNAPGSQPMAAPPGGGCDCGQGQVCIQRRCVVVPDSPTRTPEKKVDVKKVPTDPPQNTRLNRSKSKK